MPPANLILSLTQNRIQLIRLVSGCQWGHAFLSSERPNPAGVRVRVTAAASLLQGMVRRADPSESGRPPRMNAQATAFRSRSVAPTAGDKNLSVLVTNGDELGQLGGKLALATERIQ